MSMQLSDLPGPKGLPFIGMAHKINFDKLHLHLEEWADRYGSIFSVRLGPKPVVVVSDNDAMHHALRERPHGFRRTQRLEMVAKELYLKGVFAAEGEDWRRQRQIVISALNRHKLTDFFPMLAMTTARLQRCWEGAADRGEPVDLGRDLMRFTVDVTMQLAFGVDPNTLETSGPVIQQHLDKIFPMVHKRVFAPFVWWHLIRLPSDRSVERSVAALQDQVQEMVEAARKRMAADPHRNPSNFLEAILAAVEEEGSGFSDEEIFANAGTLLLAGEDTTANTIAWTMHYFTLYPDLFARARSEADAMLGKAPMPEALDQAGRLPYIDAFYNEVMRLKPVAPFLILEPVADAELLGYRIPKGTPVFFLMRHLAVNKVHFAGGDSFDPERWLTSVKDRAGPHDRRVFSPFGGGPRICPGRMLALAEIRMVLSMLCRNFDLEPAMQPGEVQEQLSFTMLPSELKVFLKRRTEERIAA